MSFIRTIEPDDASGELAAAYGKVAGARGQVANILRIHGIHPRVMLAGTVFRRPRTVDSTFRGAGIVGKQIVNVVPAPSSL